MTSSYPGKSRVERIVEYKKKLNRVAYTTAGTEISAEVSLSCLPRCMLLPDSFSKNSYKKYYRARVHLVGSPFDTIHFLYIYDVSRYEIQVPKQPVTRGS